MIKLPATMLTLLSDNCSISKNIPYQMNDANLSDLPLPLRKFFEEHSRIPAAQVQSHVLEVVWHLSFDFKSSTWSPYLYSSFPLYATSSAARGNQWCCF